MGTLQERGLKDADEKQARLKDNAGRLGARANGVTLVTCRK